MADRRPDEPPVAPSPPAAKPETDLTARINQAYASSAPIVPDESAEDDRKDRDDREDREDRSSGAERFAAVLAATTGRMRENAATGTKAGSTSPPAPAPAAVAGTSARRSTGGPSGSKPAPPRVRKARLRITHVDPWSVMKTAFLLSIALGIVTVVSVAIVWSVLGAADVWGSIDKAVNDVLGDTSNPFRIEDYLGMNRVMGFTLIVAVADVILVTVIATLGAFLYNLAAALLGGLEVVLAEEDR